MEQKEVTFNFSNVKFIESDVFTTGVATYLIGNNEKPCLSCQKPTVFVEMCSHGHFCSDECTNTFYKELQEKLKRIELKWVGEDEQNV